ncbi:MAG: response regulator [Bacteroidales bacterium]|jgi:DNA-binding NtrC family response regulator|nr:response regulator [Bacteroidales bacterium]
MKDKLIFFVDDEPMFINLLEYTFKCKTGYVIRTFGNGEDCIRHLDMNPDLVVVDYFLEIGRMSGMEVVKAIKKRNSDIAVIVLSGNSDRAAIAEAKSAGVSDYIIKDGYFIDKLTECIIKALANPALPHSADEK